MVIAQLVALGIGLGFFAGSVPGPLHTLLLKETLLRGWRRSFVIAFSPPLTDAPLIAVIVFLLDQLPDGFIPTVRLLGGGYLLYLAYRTWIELKELDKDAPVTDTGSRTLTLGRAMIVNWLNPAPYLFWATVNGPLLLRGLEDSLLAGGLYLISFYGAFVALMLVIAYTFDRLRSYSARLNLILLRASIALLLVFGVAFIAQVLAG